MDAHCGRLVLFLAVTTTFGPVVLLNETRSDCVDHVTVASAARSGATAAPIVVPGPPVRIVAPLPVKAIR